MKAEPTLKFVGEFAETLGALGADVSLVVAGQPGDMEAMARRLKEFAREKVTVMNGVGLTWPVLRDLTIEYLEMLLAELKKHKEGR